MDSDIIHNQLQELFETIQEQYEVISKTEGRIPQIEFDILLENLRKIYDQVHLLQRMNDPSVAPLQVIPPSPAKPGSAQKSRMKPGPPEPEIHKPEIKSVKRPKASIRKEAAEEEQTSKEADMDLFAGEEPTFNIKLQEAREKSLPQKPEQVEHLKSLISINDKFIFINELFDGNLKEYNESIETLNDFKDKNEAMDTLDHFRKKNLWELGSGTFMKLKEILEKMYP